ncbi:MULTISPECIES: hypothetical protein [unclassified Fibrobacter]|uniref:hypothetical protein n=1 Tax=unclassified Fibrobacter TaxID=2634177 RepID=UPI000923C457|nr:MULTISPECIES: hypothetical protein [unclassified Fibrobacter]PWJ60903.1 hypothetical protein BGX12_13310 [Fibrobacter sp. UWR4]PZW65426.1 hypothetical protein C8E88_103510 [Fibrobacter sp. UWR1]SHL52057.1 hypothetical protein SAMN05720468_1383 [Fibrobacter sp. UWEL]
MIKRLFIYLVIFCVFVSCSKDSVAQADVWENVCKLGEIVNSLDVDVEVKFRWGYPQVEDSLQVYVGSGKSFQFSDSLIESTPLFIERLLERFSEANVEAELEFKTTPLKCLTFTGPVENGEFDPRSEKAGDEMDYTIADGVSLKRLTLDSAWLKLAVTCE